MNRPEPSFRGGLLKESLNDETVLERLQVTNTSEFEQREPSPDQPRRWTAIFFEGHEDEADEIAEELSRALKPRGWYADFSTASDKFVVLPEKCSSTSSVIARARRTPRNLLVWLASPSGS